MIQCASTIICTIYVSLRLRTPLVLAGRTAAPARHSLTHPPGNSSHLRLAWQHAHRLFQPFDQNRRRRGLWHGPVSQIQPPDAGESPDCECNRRVKEESAREIAYEQNIVLIRRSIPYIQTVSDHCRRARSLRLQQGAPTLALFRLQRELSSHRTSYPTQKASLCH